MERPSSFLTQQIMQHKNCPGEWLFQALLPTPQVLHRLTVYPHPAEMSTRKSFPPAGASTSWRENVKPKHSRDAPNGWYRYETQFAVPVLNAKKAIDHYTVYGGTLLIRNDTDGRSYLYDLLDVQKKEGNQLNSLLRRKAFGSIRAKTFCGQYTHLRRKCQHGKILHGPPNTHKKSLWHCVTDSPFIPFIYV